MKKTEWQGYIVPGLGDAGDKILVLSNLGYWKLGYWKKRA